MSSNLLITWTDFYTEVENLITTITKSQKKYELILAVTRGGLVPAYYIAKILDLPVKTINVTSYISQKEIGEIKHIPVDGFSEIVTHAGNCLLVDDICDSGQTLEFIQNKFPEVDTACIYTRYPNENLTYNAKVLNHDAWLDFPWEVMWDGHTKMRPEGL